MNEIDLFLIEMDGGDERRYTKDDHIVIVNFFKNILRYITPEYATGLVYYSNDHEVFVETNLDGLIMNVSAKQLLKISMPDSTHTEVVMAWTITCQQD